MLLPSTTMPGRCAGPTAAAKPVGLPDRMVGTVGNKKAVFVFPRSRHGLLYAQSQPLRLSALALVCSASLIAFIIAQASMPSWSVKVIPSVTLTKSGVMV